MSPPKLADTEYQEGKGQPPKSEGGALSSEQFDTLVKLLTPGYEVSKLMLEDYQRQQAARAEIEAAQQAAQEPAPKG